MTAIMRNDANNETLLAANVFHNVDSLSIDGMEKIKSKSITVILTDLPFGTTQNKWDSIIPLNDYVEIEIQKNKKVKIEKFTKDDYLLYCYKNNFNLKAAEEYWQIKHKKGLWHHYNRILKDDGVALLFAQKPYDTTLHNSNIENFRYEWIWEKTQATGHLNGKKMPMKAHESILVFYKKLPYYNPQKTQGHKPMNSGVRRSSLKNYNYNEINKIDLPFGGDEDRFPRSIVKISSDKQFSYIHPTQKPVEIYEYFLRTYSKAGDIILDNCSGSGTLAVACENVEDRDFICIEKDKEHGYFEDSVDRLKIHKVLREVTKDIIITSSELKTKDVLSLASKDERILNLTQYRRGDEVLKKIKKNIENIIEVFKRSAHLKIEDDFIIWLNKDG